MDASAIKNGQIAFTIRSILMLPALHATFSTVPTGGVSRPMTVTIINTTPKYAGSMPAVLIAGKRTGVRIIMVGVTSMEVPTSSTSRQMTSISSVGLERNGESSVVTVAGIFATVIIHEDTIAAAARNIIMDEDFAAETRQSINILILNSR